MLGQQSVMYLHHFQGDFTVEMSRADTLWTLTMVAYSLIFLGCCALTKRKS